MQRGEWGGGQVEKSTSEQQGKGQECKGDKAGGHTVVTVAVKR